jgi:hypothetical protein
VRGRRRMPACMCHRPAAQAWGRPRLGPHAGGGAQLAQHVVVRVVEARRPEDHEHAGQAAVPAEELADVGHVAVVAEAAAQGDGLLLLPAAAGAGGVGMARRPVRGRWWRRWQRWPRWRQVGAALCRRRSARPHAQPARQATRGDACGALTSRAAGVRPRRKRGTSLALANCALDGCSATLARSAQSSVLKLQPAAPCVLCPWCAAVASRDVPLP